MRTTPSVLTLAGAICLSAILGLSAVAADRNAERPSEYWEDLKVDIVGEAEITRSDDVIALETPYRAEDAAVVPVSIEITPPEGRSVKSYSLIVDGNPAPVAGEFEVGSAMPVIAMSTRVRVDQYSNIRVVATMDDGSHYMAANYVKASGGCSAPALKDQDAALASVGKIKMRQFEEVSFATAKPVQSGGLREAQLLVRHPNYSGMQMDQVTRLFIPAYFINEVEVLQGDETVFRMTGGISISENPAIRFTYRPNGAEALTIRATDTSGGVFERKFPVGSSS